MTIDLVVTSWTVYVDLPGKQRVWKRTGPDQQVAYEIDYASVEFLKEMDAPNITLWARMCDQYGNPVGGIDGLKPGKDELADHEGIMAALTPMWARYRAATRTVTL